MWNVKTKVIPIIRGGGEGGRLEPSKIIQKIPEQRTGKARNQGTTENSHIGHCTHSAESTNVKVENIQHGK
jgi:hypothetical protein